MKPVFTSIVFLLLLVLELKAQCTPNPAETCEQANVLCSLDELNGYACNNPGTVPSHCSVLCSQGGVGHNTSWWGFVTQGGNVTITLTIGGCTFFGSPGLQFGIWGDCSCSEDVFCRSIPCMPPNSVEVINVKLVPCRTYYLWVDGCSSDICDFTLNTSGGHTPTLSPLGFINDEPSGVIDSVCVHTCNYKFYINKFDACKPTYQWTLDGDDVGANSNEISLDFPDVGDFVLCVTAYIGNPKSGSTCSQEGPRCTTVKVRPLPDRMGLPRVICYEQANPGGFKWHAQRVFGTEKYRQQFTDSNCCRFDSVVCFTVLEQPEPPEVYHITCNNAPFIDLTGRAWVGCKSQFQIPLPKSTEIFQCDSSILLTSVSVNYNARISANVVNDTLMYSPNVKIANPCNVGEVYEFGYNWRLLGDSTNTILSKDEHFRPVVPGDYVVDVIVKCIVGTDSAFCEKSFTEDFEELKFLKSPQVSTMLEVCPTDTNWVTALVQPLHPFTSFVWEITGGIILSKPDSASVQLAWNLHPGDTGIIRVYYTLNGQESHTATVNVYTTSKGSAGKDFTVYGKSAMLGGRSALKGRWGMIDGSFSAIIDDHTNVRSSVTVEAFGVYCFQWLANLKSCEEVDTVCIKFKELTTYNDHEEPKKERGDSLSGKLTLRKNWNKETEIRISKMSAEIVALEFIPGIHTKVDVEWLDLTGRTIKYEMGKNAEQQSFLQIKCPEIGGIYFLKLTLGKEVFLMKLVIPK